MLVLGFGPFRQVRDNPAARLARALNGSRLPRGGRVIGEVMPVTWEAASGLAESRAQEIDASMILGIGVAVGREAAMIERFARRTVSGEVPDAAGSLRTELRETGPDRLECSIADRWAAALGVGLSEDAGRYVCNAWLWHALDARLPAAFLHVPAEGLDVRETRRGLRRFARWWRAGGQMALPIALATEP
jgi:pyroglutamyl-peptidase